MEDSQLPLILIVDDAEAIRSALATLLTRAGFRTLTAPDGASTLTLLESTRPDLMLLDIVLDESNPQGQTGLDLLRQIRTLDLFIPVFMLTSYAEWQMESLGLGAIAFIMKPWDANALISQIRATLNAIHRIRQDTLRVQETAARRLRLGDIEIDTDQLRVFRAGKEIDLTPLEFALLTFLVRNPNREWTRDDLLTQVWGYEWIGYSRTVDRHVASIRRKLNLQHNEVIETVHTVGYRLVP
jgi:two-component system alkaline phosphatase synthesis response regulator PhoP